MIEWLKTIGSVIFGGLLALLLFKATDKPTTEQNITINKPKIKESPDSEIEIPVIPISGEVKKRGFLRKIFKRK